MLAKVAENDENWRGKMSHSPIQLSLAPLGRDVTTVAKLPTFDDFNELCRVID